MSKIELVRYNSPILKTSCRELSTEELSVSRCADFDLNDLIGQMKSLMLERNGIGLAAPQIGIPVRLFVMISGDSMISLINPEVINKSEETEIAREGCLSRPGYESEPIERPKWVEVKSGGHVYRFKGLEARCAMHEIDHLNGIVIWND